ncbi:NAD-dependent epimerase/dehydratase family protein [bacterium]|nr:MAG: NAD-dependent epimerase/dehydratase family protein [bacterium]
MNILLTGGAGFIGSHVLDTFIDLKYNVTVIDNFDLFYDKQVKMDNINKHLSNPLFKLVQGDIADVYLYDKLPSNFDVIIHLAAKAGVRPSILNPIDYQRVNVNGTQNLLDFAKTNNIKQFVFASSSSVYGVNPNVPWNESDYVLNPISPYASTKISGELLGHVYSHLYDIRFIALRFFTVFGPRQRPDLAIHKFMNKIENGLPIPVFGDGSTSRDYTYIDDIVSGIISASLYNETNFEVINLGNHHVITLKSMIDSLERVIGKKANIEWLPKQPGDVDRTYASIEKAKKILNYVPSTNFEDGLNLMYDWFRGKQK